MTEETSTPAETTQAAEQHTTSADQQPAGDTLSDIFRSSEAERPTEEHHDEMPEHEHEDHDGEQPRRKKASGAERAKRREEYLINEHRAREEQLTAALRERESLVAELERSISQRDQDRSEGERRRIDDAHAERLTAARELVLDFDRVMARTKDVDVSDALISEIKGSEKSALLAYTLAQNPDKLRALNEMPERAMIREIARLEGSIRMPAGKQKTSAPPPPTTLRGGAAPHTDLAQVNDMKEFSRRLLQDLAKRKER